MQARALAFMGWGARARSGEHFQCRTLRIYVPWAGAEGDYTNLAFSPWLKKGLFGLSSGEAALWILSPISTAAWSDSEGLLRTLGSQVHTPSSLEPLLSFLHLNIPRAEVANEQLAHQTQLS